MRPSPSDESPQTAPPPAAGVPLGTRMLGAVGRILITTGVVVLLFVVFQLWGTNIQEARAQDDLRGEFDSTYTEARAQLAVLDAGTTTGEAAALPAPATTLPGGYTPELLSYFFPEGGDAIARIEIPAIGVDKIVVNGVQVADLRSGPGHYPSTATVGTPGNTAIAGHRTTYGAPFNRIDELDPGDEIRVTSVLGEFTYRVMAPEVAFADELATVDGVAGGHIIVRPGATWVLTDFGDNRITLTACHPKLSSRQRIIVAAALVDEPTEAPEFAAETIAAFVGGDEGPTLPGEDLSAPTTEAPANTDLDEGLNGERDAIPGAVAWMLAATALWVLAGMMARRLFDDRLHRAAVRLIGLAPVAVCLWFSFEMIDRALPAG